MKKLMLLGCLLSAFACTEEPAFEPEGGGAGGAAVVGRVEGAVKGTLAVRLTPSAAEAVETARAKTRSASTRSGIEITDEILERIGTDRFERIFPYDEVFEAQHRASGLHLWYRIHFDEEFPLAKAGELLGADTCIAVVEYTRDFKPVKPRPVHGQAVGASLSQTRAPLPMNDEKLIYQWHYDNRGGSFLGGNMHFEEMVAGADINLFNAWELCTGDPSVVVAVIDEPVQTNHPDLAANIWVNTIDASSKGLHGYNFYGNTATLDWKSFHYDPEEKPEFQYEYADHGTHVAGTIAAVNGNGIGVCGIAGGKNGTGGVKVMSCQIMGYGNEVTGKNYDPIPQAFVYAADRGAIIAQNSWGYGEEMTESGWGSSEGSLRTSIDYFINNAGANNRLFPDAPLKGGLVLFAAGNYGDRVKDRKIWPAAYDKVIAVGAMDWGFRPAYYTDYGSWVDITAPGGDLYTGISSSSDGYSANAMVFSTVLQDPAMDFKDGRADADQAYWFGYDFSQGTSMACPHVSGVAALGLSYAARLGKQFTVEEFRSLLLSSVYGIEDHFTGSKTYYYTEEDRYVRGFIYPAQYTGKMGGGCVDALKLLLAVKGTPAIYVKTGESATVDLARYFGGNSSVRLTSAALSSPSSLGLSAPALLLDGTKFTVRCTKPGVSMLTIRALSGDVEFSREFALVSRPRLADNGGWL